MSLSSETVAGIVVTVSIHIAVAIPLLALQLGFEVQKEQSFVLDFSKQEEQEQKQQEEQEQKQKQDLSRAAAQKLDQMIAAPPAVRNITVNRSQLKDDRNTDADQLYRDAARPAEELRNGQKQNPPEEDEVASVSDPNTNPSGKTDPQPQAYSGASVLYWQLDGRNATHLPVPAYRCYGAGEVTVIITVDNQGRVIDARIDESATSSADGCLRNHAIRAARSSRFTPSQTAPAKQKGTITYQFVAQ